MATEELVFVGVQAFVGRVLGPTQCEFFYERSEFSESKLVPVDLQKSPVNSPWPQVIVDSHQGDSIDGYTLLGPRFHLKSSHIGAVYLELKYFKGRQSLGQLLDWPHTPDAIFQYQSILRKDDSNNLSRYHGFRAQIIDVRATIALIDIYQADRPGPQKRCWLDLGDPLVCDPPSNKHTSITPDIGSTGALFLTAKAIEDNDIKLPKLPLGDGGG